MLPNAQVAPGYYVWTPEGGSVAVHLNLEVADLLSVAIMRGYGSIPKRGAEAGGVLLGTIYNGIVRIEDFEPVKCGHSAGPSYSLSTDEKEMFEEVCRRWGSNGSRYAVGYFRSHTREGLGLSAEDHELLDLHFPERHRVALLVKPFM